MCLRSVHLQTTSSLKSRCSQSFNLNSFLSWLIICLDFSADKTFFVSHLATCSLHIFSHGPCASLVFVPYRFRHHIGSCTGHWLLSLNVLVLPLARFQNLLPSALVNYCCYFVCALFFCCKAFRIRDKEEARNNENPHHQLKLKLS